MGQVWFNVKTGEVFEQTVHRRVTKDMLADDAWEYLFTKDHRRGPHGWAIDYAWCNRCQKHHYVYNSYTGNIYNIDRNYINLLDKTHDCKVAELVYEVEAHKDSQYYDLLELIGYLWSELRRRMPRYVSGKEYDLVKRQKIMAWDFIENSFSLSEVERVDCTYIVGKFRTESREIRLALTSGLDVLIPLDQFADDPVGEAMINNEVFTSFLSAILTKKLGFHVEVVFVPLFRDVYSGKMAIKFDLIRAWNSDHPLWQVFGEICDTTTAFLERLVERITIDIIQNDEKLKAMVAVLGMKGDFDDL